MKFRTSNEKSYNLEYKIEKGIMNLIKADNKIDKKNLEQLVNKVAYHHIDQFTNVPKKLYPNDNKDLVDIAKEPQENLLKIFNIDRLYKSLNLNPNYVVKKFENNDEFRRKVMKISLYKIISSGGKNYGSEYGLIYAKTFNFLLDTPMRYVSYKDGILDERFIKYVDTYLELGGSPNVYWLKNYFSDNTKAKYDIEELGEVIKILNLYLKERKRYSR